tara:strand:- start:591 stop:755 length:165 start_codon:yes stop_codon:yes gene_type:complete
MAVVLRTDNHIYSINKQLFTTFLVLVVISITSLILLAAYAVQNILSGISDYFAK